MLGQKFPLLRVFTLPGDRLDFTRPGAVRPPVDEAWWNSVLNDYRARVPGGETIAGDDPHVSQYRLDRQPPVILIPCDCKPGKGELVKRADLLVRSYGPDTNVQVIARRYLRCEHRGKLSNHCKAYVKR